MAAVSTNKANNRKATPPKAKTKTIKLSKSKKALLKKAQDAGGISDIAVSHTSKEKILKKVRGEKH